jgi:regulator of protease activity HflC (stomatin/prohibitin superfamily)
MFLKKIAALLLISVSVVACSKVPAGNVGVKVYLLGQEKGVDKEILGPGRYWIGMNEDLFLFPTFTQNYSFTEEGERMIFQTKDGMTVKTGVGVSYSINPDKVSDIFQKYRKGVDEITSMVLRNMIRDAFNTEASTRPIESVYGGGKAALIAAVEKRVREQVQPIGINVERIFLIGELELPPQIVERINATIDAQQKTQQKLFEVDQQKAEAAKRIEDAKGDAESIRLRSEAEAKANKILAESLTSDLVKYKMIEKWNGSTPKVTGGGSQILIEDSELLKE